MRALVRARPRSSFTLRCHQASQPSAFSIRYLASSIFDESAKTLQKRRAAQSPVASTFDYLRDDAADRVIDRLSLIRGPFPLTIDLGCGSGHIRRALQSHTTSAYGVPGGVDLSRLIELDSHIDICRRASTFARSPALPLPEDIPSDGVDAVLSACWLHWTNDPAGAVRAVAKALRPDGLFLGAMPGGETLRELRVALQLAEEEIVRGVAARVSPMVRVADAGAILGEAGLVMRTVDVEKVVVRYKDLHAVMKHMRGMGENNAVNGRRPLRRDVLKRAQQIYKERFSETDAAGHDCVTATFELIHMIGWKAGPKRQRPKERGSAQRSFTDLGLEPTPLG